MRKSWIGTIGVRLSGALALLPALFLALAWPVPGSAESVQDADHSVALIIAEGEDSASGGTGWAIADGGFFVTNNHVIADASWLNVVTVDAAGHPHKNPAQVVWASADYDLALIHAPGAQMAPLPVTDWVPPKGTHVVAIGFPGVADENFGEGIIPESTVTDGIVGRMLHVPWQDSPTAIDIVQHSAAINHGNSGGPLLDTCGRVIGINTQIVPAGENGVQPGISFASHADNLIAQLREHVPQVPINVASGACNGAPATPSADATGAATGTGGVNWALVAGLGIPAALVFAGIMASQNRKQIVETYTQYRRRKGGAGPAPPPTPSPRPGPSSGGNWLLSGRTASGRPIEFRIPPDGASMTVGRDAAQCQLVIADDGNTVSRRHALLETEGGRLFVTDLGSANGTRLDGTRLGSSRTAVASGQKLQFGEAVVDRIRRG